MRKVVTTYINPDMDGISLMYAYTEFLNCIDFFRKIYYNIINKLKIRVCENHV